MFSTQFARNSLVNQETAVGATNAFVFCLLLLVVIVINYGPIIPLL
jgi:hypothetical protein